MVILKKIKEAKQNMKILKHNCSNMDYSDEELEEIGKPEGKFYYFMKSYIK